MKKIELTENNFENLLNWLDSDRNAAGRKYEMIRERLIKIFYGNGCFAAEEMADETIDRVSRKVETLSAAYQGEPSLYFYAVAKKVFLEFNKQPKPEELPQHLSGKESQVEAEAEADYNRCLKECLAKIPAQQAQLIIAYYAGEKQAKIKQRKKLAESLGISEQGLRVRALRIRQNLHKCVSGCVRKKFS